MDKLKPCPFCGSEAGLFSKPNERKQSLSPLLWAVRCLRCNANQFFYSSDHDAIEAWNRRASDVGEAGGRDE